MDAYVVAPSCEGPGTQDKWLPKIKEYQVAVNGYPSDNRDCDKKIGRRFAQIADGSLIIIAHGANANKHCYYAGIADGPCDAALAQKIGATQARRLRSFISLEGKDVPFNEECKMRKSAANLIDSCYALDPDQNPSDKTVVDFVLRLIKKTEGGMVVCPISALKD